MTDTTIKNDIDMLILGSGLSGMLTALAFAQIGIKSIIIETHSLDSSEFFSDLRTTALTPFSREFLEHIGLWQEVETISAPILDIYTVDNKAPQILHFYLKDYNELLGNSNHLGYIVENALLKRMLLAAVQKNNLIALIDNCNYRHIKSLEDSNIVQLSNNELINCKLLAICDGHKSKARHYYFCAKIEKYYRQTALTFNIEHEKAHEGTAMEHFMPSGPFAVLPLRTQHHSSVIWTVKDSESELLLSLPQKELEYLVQRNLGIFLGNSKINGKITSFPLQARLTDRYYHNHIVVLADSAHIIHPLAGQGLNQGIKDIKALAELIQDNGIHKLTLEKYQQLRERDNMAMYLLTDNLNKIFSNDSSLLHFFRRIGLSAINRSDSIKEQLIKYAIGKR